MTNEIMLIKGNRHIKNRTGKRVLLKIKTSVLLATLYMYVIPNFTTVKVL